MPLQYLMPILEIFVLLLQNKKKSYALAVVVVNLFAEKNCMLLVQYHMQTFNKRELV